MVSDQQLLEVLRRDFGLSEKHEKLARVWQRESGKPLPDILLEMRVVTESNLLKALARAAAEPRSREATHDGSERREHARRGLPDGFKVFIVSQTGSREPAVIRDLSEGGIGIEARHLFAVGQRLILEVVSAGGTKVMCGAQVRFTRELAKQGGNDGHAMAGIEFLDLTATMRFAIAAILAEARKRADALDDIWTG